MPSSSLRFLACSFIVTGAAVACSSSDAPPPSFGGSGQPSAGAAPSLAGAGGAPSAGGGSALAGATSIAGAATGGAGSAGTVGTAGTVGAAGNSGGTGLGAWKYFRELKLDTTTTGANLTVDVPKYPVAIVLRAADFDFTQAKPDGSDVRFTTADGTAVPYAIESWDAAGKVAALWLKLDVKANSMQSVIMSWGNPAATDSSASNTVFDTQDGFLGVWHLAETGSTTAGAYKDATATAADLTGLKVTADSVTSAGRIGKAVSLDHALAQWLRLDGTKNAAFDVYQHVTYSIWTYAKQYDVQYQTPFAKGDNSWRIHMYGASDWAENGNKHIVEMCCESGGEDLCALNEPPSKGTDVAPLKWFHWVAVLDSPNLTLYLNGVKEITLNGGGSWKSDATYPVGIGANSQIGGRTWNGYLDEARVMNVSKDAAWAKLEYESQRDGQTLTKLGAAQQRF